MDTSTGILAIIPARGGSKGLPGKNIRPFAGLPLIAHSILFAKQCSEIVRTIVTTDSPEIADVAKSFGAEVPFIRPAELSKDNTPLWPVLQHALKFVEAKGEEYRQVVLLDPTTPCRLPIYVYECFQRMMVEPEADGIIGVSRPEFNPIWHSVIEKDGYMKDLFAEGSAIARRQDAPTVYRINGSIYMWRTEFMRSDRTDWRKDSNLLIYETPDYASISIDTVEEFERAELWVKSGQFPLPWLEPHGTTR